MTEKWIHYYQIWGADVISDVELDLEDKAVKMNLVLAKAQIDSNDLVTKLFLIWGGKLRAFPDGHFVKEYRDKFGKDYYEMDWVPSAMN